MPSFEEEAFSRAQQMHSRVPPQTANHQRRNTERKEDSKQVHTESTIPPPPPAVKCSENITAQKSNTGLLDNLFGNREQSLILLLIVLLMEENADPSLLLALMYLLL
ncbi:MAG: hypothetical protein U0L20_04360 [Ruminococcus sp.]|nr:hypothetical protein [Ruminococcus sp.]